MRPVEEWRDAWRWFSLQAMVLSGVAQAAWDALPADLKQYLPHRLGLVLSLSLLLLGIGGRLVKQRRIDPMMTLLGWLGGRIAGPVAVLCALFLAGGLVWQTGRIDGWPLVGGGLKAQVAGLGQQLAAHDLAQAKAEAAALMAQRRMADAANEQARAHAIGDQKIQTQIQNVIEGVRTHVTEKSDAGCVIPLGAVRLLDAAASGADVGDVAARIAPGQPDDAASGITLSDAVALLAADLGIARQNADQLTHLEKAVAP